jgi:hypothetical protein
VYVNHLSVSLASSAQRCSLRRILVSQRLAGARGFDDLIYRCTARRSIVRISPQRRVIRALDYSVHAVGGKRGQLTLRSWMKKRCP